MTDSSVITAAADTRSLEEGRRRGVRFTVVILVAFIATVLGLFYNKFTSPRVLSATDLRVNGAFEFDKPRIFKDFQLTDHRGQAFSLANLQDKWTLMFFGFTYCPDICPTTMATLNELVGTLDEKILDNTQVVLVSVDPARDTVDKLAQYVPYFNEDFIGLTGEFLQIKRLATQLNIAFNKVTLEDTYTVDHSANVVLINPKGHYHGFFKPPLDIARLKLTYQSMVTAF
ncbi:SCO family protein [Exilibacterium tricleocarpae]|uniref:SCO family protein n=1 Tax=Exilibacterium tricleocarpae TaxID=2591008 RepID=A0A545T0G7_9GAMM|nr:SCO family protein [Exilibacterium tricleocarpae]TQV70718.1 SCO family protein [Exilibacterium tricleocarpae]